MKIDIPIAIIISAIIIATSIYLVSLKDPLSNCINLVMKESDASVTRAARLCSGAGYQ